MMRKILIPLLVVLTLMAFYNLGRISTDATLRDDKKKILAQKDTIKQQAVKIKDCVKSNAYAWKHLTELNVTLGYINDNPQKIVDELNTMNDIEQYVVIADRCDATLWK